MRNSLNIKIIFFLALVFLSATAPAHFSDINIPTSVSKQTTKKESKYYLKSQLNPVEVKYYMDSIGIKHSEVVLKQALLETGHFKSKLLMNKNNLFAFRFTKRYMNFETWQMSVDYYKQWQEKFYTNDKEDYYHFLRRIKYARSPEYIKVLKKVRIK
jgi:flagellum-specific peptidoglycan hydrolase FlgJ